MMGDASFQARFPHERELARDETSRIFLHT